MDGMEGTGEEPALQLSYLVVQLNASSDAPLSDLLLEDGNGGIEAFAFPDPVPPGNVGQACCVRAGVWDLTIGAGGDNPHFQLFEDQMLFGGMDHVYTVTLQDSSVVIDDLEIRAHVEE
jgi:hypothetical protein